MLQLLLASNVYLLGLGAVVSLVVYPSFSLVGDVEWPYFHSEHSRRIALAVAPAWILEAVGSTYWLLTGSHHALAVLQGICALGAVVLTVLFAVPLHNAIAAQRTIENLRRLKTAHNLRVVLWLLAVASTWAAL